MKQNKSLSEIKEILDQHRDELRGKYRITRTAVFGSYARDEQVDKSDIDIIAEFGEEISLLTLSGAQVYLAEILGMKVDLVPREDIRPELRETILKESVQV